MSSDFGFWCLLGKGEGGKGNEGLHGGREHAIELGCAHLARLACGRTRAARAEGRERRRAGEPVFLEGFNRFHLSIPLNPTNTFFSQSRYIDVSVPNSPCQHQACPTHRAIVEMDYVTQPGKFTTRHKLLQSPAFKAVSSGTCSRCS